MQLFDIFTPWTGWITAALLCIILLICAIQPRSLLLSLQTLSSPIQRRYAPKGNSPVLFLLRAVYQLSTISLALLMATTAYIERSNALTPKYYGLGIVAVMAVMLVKGILDKWLLFTFRFPINETTYLKYRSELWQVLSLVLWLYIFFSPWCSARLTWLIPCIAIGCYLLILWWKIMQVFGWTFEHICYALLYTLHMEFLPVGIMAGSIIHIIQ